MPQTYSAEHLPIIRPLMAVCGNTWRSPIYRHSNPESGTPRDLTGTQIAVVITFANGTTAHPTIVRDDAAGTYRLTASAEKTSAWPPGRGTYRIVFTDPLGVVLTYWSGPFVVTGA